MTGFEPANGGVTIHCLTTWLHPPYLVFYDHFRTSRYIFIIRERKPTINFNTLTISSRIKDKNQALLTLKPQKRIGADSGNRTRTSCLEGKGTTTMQYPLSYLFYHP